MEDQGNGIVEMLRSLFGTQGATAEGLLRGRDAYNQYVMEAQERGEQPLTHMEWEKQRQQVDALRGGGAAPMGPTQAPPPY